MPQVNPLPGRCQWKLMATSGGEMFRIVSLPDLEVEEWMICRRSGFQRQGQGPPSRSERRRSLRGEADLRTSLPQGQEGDPVGNLAMVPNQEGERPSSIRSSQPNCIHVEEGNSS